MKQQQCLTKKYFHVLWMFMFMLLLSGCVKFASRSFSNHSAIGDSFQLEDLQDNKERDLLSINQRFA